MQVPVVLLNLALAFVYVLAGMARLQALPASEAVRVRLRLPVAVWRSLGAVELVGALGLVVGVFAIPELAVAAAVGFALMMGGALVAHLRVGDRAGAVPPLVLGVVTALDAWLVQAFLS